MKKTFIQILAVAVCLVCVSSSRAAVNMGIWTFPTTSGPPTPNAGSTHTGTTVSMALTGGATYSANGTTLNAPTGGTATKALTLTYTSAAHTPTITISLTGGLAGFSLYTLTYAAANTGSSTARTMTWTYSLNGGAFTAFTTAQTDTIAASTTFAAQSDTFTGVNFATATSLVFRGTLTGATSTGRGARFDNITLTAAVPEPTNYALAGFGLIFIVGIAGRQVLVCRRSRAAH